MKILLSLYLICIIFFYNEISLSAKNTDKIYISKNGFKIIYPSDWYLYTVIDEYNTIDEAQENGGNYFHIYNYDHSKRGDETFRTNELKIVVYVFNIKNKNFNNWLNDKIISFEEKEKNRSTIIFDNKKFIRLITSYANKENIYFFYNNKSSVVLFYYYSKDNKLQQEFINIIKTFEFKI